MPIRERFKFDNVEGVRVGRFNRGINTTFILYRIGNTLIDSGPTNQWRAVKQFVDEKPVSQLLLTHHHEDHSGNAARIAKQQQLIPFAPALSQNKLANGFRIPFWQQIIWGRSMMVETRPFPTTIPLAGGTTLTPIHTPGHAKDLHCLYAPERGWIFTADLYLARSIRYLRADENLSQMIASVRKVLASEFDVLFCAHRGILENGKQALQEKYENMLTLCAEAQQLHQNGVELGQIVTQLLGKEEAIAHITSFNFSKANLIKEALKVSLE